MQTPRSLPAPPSALRHDRGPFWRLLGRAYLKASGWRVEGVFPETGKAVIIVAPHTSNWDFLAGMSVVLALDLRASWLGKHTIFKRPFRGLLRWLGGIPVDRGARNGVVGACVEAFAAAPALLLALSPEGTRKGASRWRSGFYLIASGAGVPILPVALDYRDHVVRLLPPFQPTGSLESDLPVLKALFDGVQGLRPRPEGG